VAEEFQQIDWDSSVEEDCRQIVRLAIREDLDRQFDWTTVCLVTSGVTAEAAVVARRDGVVAGLHAAVVALGEMDATAELTPDVEDGARIEAGQRLALVRGPARTLLTAERTLLNLIGRLSGVATLTRQYVDAVQGKKAHVYDTRKTTPGWRRLEKYAVRCGGGRNHRTGLFDAILIKDNHLALATADGNAMAMTPRAAVRRAREFAQALASGPQGRQLIVEVEVDTLEQLEDVLGERPDIVLLDNMPPEVLRQAVATRDARGMGVELEASGGVTLQNIAAIAACGVDRISVGALTHSAVSLDVGLDWR
jgi:nicotinate-nucleotide pyrophosphorylase (carboxylating)